MHKPFRHTIATADGRGREARKGKTSRAENPFARPSPREASMITPDLREILVTAWWRGWDDQDARAGQ